MNLQKLGASVLFVWMSLQLSALAQVRNVKPSIDDLIDWSGPMAMTQQKLTAFLDANTKDPTKPIYQVAQAPRSTSVVFQILEDDKNCKLDGRLFGGTFKVQKVSAYYSLPSGVAYHFTIELSNKLMTKKKMADLEALLAKKTGDANPKEVQMSRTSDTNLQWRHPKYRVDLYVRSQSVEISIDSLAPLSP